MSLSQDIMNLLSDEGYKINEAIREALNDFVTIVEEEADAMSEDLEDDDMDDD